MCHKLDARFFDRLAGLSPDDVCRRARCDHDADRGCYRLEAWGAEYEVVPAEREIRPLAGARPASAEFGLAIVFYLLECRDVPLADEWVSEKDLPGGVSFFQGPHQVPGRLPAERFGRDVAAFSRVARALGGTPVEMGDAAFVFRALARVPVVALLWQEDDEFPADLRLLFDRTIGGHLPLDVIFGLCEEVCRRLATTPDPGSA